MPKLVDLASLEHLAQALGTELERIDEYAKHAYQVSFYQVIGIPKRGKNRAGERRTVYAANERWLAEMHKQIAVLVNASATWPEHVTGFVRNGSIKLNAKPHCKKRVLLHADLKDFFDTISIDHVEEALRSLGAPSATVRVLARLSTIDGQLRQGTRCAPVIANVVCANLDRALIALAMPLGADYTRYADNLTFSGDRVPVGAEVERVVGAHGFTLRDPCVEQHRGHRQFVTGLSVVDATPRLPRRLKQQMRLVMHFVAKLGVDEHLARVQAKQRTPYPLTEGGLDGMLRFMHSIEPALAAKFRIKFDKGVAKSEKARDEAKEEERREEDARDDCSGER